jgi:hypothetical protein
MSSDARDFNNMETRAVIEFVFLQGKAPKETLGKHAPSYATPSKNGWPSLNVVFFHLGCASSWTTQNSDHHGDY